MSAERYKTSSIESVAKGICVEHGNTQTNAWDLWQGRLGVLPGYPVHDWQGQYAWPVSRYGVRYQGVDGFVPSDVRIVGHLDGQSAEAATAMRNLHVASSQHLPVLPSSRALMYGDIAAATSRYVITVTPAMQGMDPHTFEIDRPVPLEVDVVADDVSGRGEVAVHEDHLGVAAAYRDDMALIMTILDRSHLYSE